MTTPDDLSVLSTKAYSDAIARLLNLKTNASSLAFLIGAGCSYCAGLPLTNALTDIVLKAKLPCETSQTILSGVEATFADGNEANIEDYLSEIVDMLAIAERRLERGVTRNANADTWLPYTADQLRKATQHIHQAIAEAIDRKVDMDIHRRFISSVHRPVRVGRSAQSKPVDYLVLNYDTIIEDALAMERIPYADGSERRADCLVGSGSV